MEKEKLLVTSNFSFSHSVFIRLVLQTRNNEDLFQKELNEQRKTNTLYFLIMQIRNVLDMT